MTTGMRGGEGSPEGRADAEANECPKAICEQLHYCNQLQELSGDTFDAKLRTFQFTLADWTSTIIVGEYNRWPESQ